jgi:cell shape-determining protein MreC
MLFVLAIGWLYVILLIALASESLGQALLLIGLGIGPVLLVFVVLARWRRSVREQMRDQRDQAHTARD